MTRRPSMQFYPADWAGSSNLRRCTHEEKGVWIDIMCLFHDAEKYGILRWFLKEISQSVGARRRTVLSLVSKGILKGSDEYLNEPFIYTPRSGRKLGNPVILIEKQAGPIWYSSRMVRDEYVRVHAGANSRFGSPSRREGESPSRRQGERQSDGPSSSSSSTTTYISGGNGKDIAPPLIDRDLNPVITRSIELAKLLRERGAALNATDPYVVGWAQQGISDAQALAALETALTRREKSGSTQPVNAGYLDAMLRDPAPVARITRKSSTRARTFEQDLTDVSWAK